MKKKIDYQKLQKKSIEELTKIICPYCQSDIYPIYLPIDEGYKVICSACDREIENYDRET